MKKIFTLLGVLAMSFYGHAQVTIAQIYGGGGNSGATYKLDYVVLFNKTATPVNLNGWSLQYGSATSTTNWSGKVSFTTGTIQPYSYFLVSLQGGANGASLPTVDYDATTAGGFNAATANGKIALMNNTTTINGISPTGAVDFVGFGTANGYEGGAAAPAPSVTNAIFRINGGCTDTNVNGSDFISAAAAPKNSASSINDCSTLGTSDLINLKNIFLKNTMVDNTLSFQAKGNASVKVYNANGQLVKSATISAQNANVDVASLPKGNYVVTAELNGEKISQKVIKK